MVVGGVEHRAEEGDVWVHFLVSRMPAVILKRRQLLESDGWMARVRPWARAQVNRSTMVGLLGSHLLRLQVLCKGNDIRGIRMTD